MGVSEDPNKYAIVSATMRAGKEKYVYRATIEAGDAVDVYTHFISEYSSFY